LRAADPLVEPFAQRLPVVATGPRALLPLWRVAECEDGELDGIAFAALREARDGPQRSTLEIYAAVAPRLRRQGVGRALLEPLLSLPQVTLRARVRDGHEDGRAFLEALGFAQVSAQLSLTWDGERRNAPDLPALRIRNAVERDREVLERLSNDAWADIPDSFSSRADEIAQLFTKEDRLVLVAEADGRAIGYFAALRLGRALGIEEVAVLPAFRRRGVGRALLAAALAGKEGAVLSVGENNRAARALYRSLGFALSARRIVLERQQ